MPTDGPGLAAILEEAARTLPEGFRIEIHIIGGNSGSVDLWRDCRLIELSPDPFIEGGMPAAVADAIETAKRLAAAED